MIDFRDLQVWHKAHLLALEVYRETGSFPKHECFGLTSQLRRAALSIPTNISEGSGFDSDRELARFMRIARGSASEVEYLLLVSRDLGYVRCEQADSLIQNTIEIRRMLTGFLRRLDAKG